MTPTIIIGLGSTGKAVLLKIRKMIVEKYGALDQLPIISFLLIDTDANNLKPQVERTNNQDISLWDEEKVYARIDKAVAKEILDSLLRDVSGVSKKLSEDQSLEDWLKKIIGTIESPDSNFDEVFEIGELCEYAFSHNYVAIKEKFLKALEGVRSGRQHMNDIGDKIEDGVNVIIACSLWEGVGSGMFLNLAYHLRDWLRDEEKTNILGGLIESRNLKNSRQKYNNADALKKLNSHRSFIPLYPAEEGISDIVAKGEPFDRCFEVDANIVNLQIPDLNAVMEIAKNIFSTINNDYSTWNGIIAVLIFTKNFFARTKGRKIVKISGVFLAIISILSVVFQRIDIPPRPNDQSRTITTGDPTQKDIKAIYLEDVIEKADKIDTSLPNQEKMMMDGSVSMVTLMSKLRKKSFNEQEYKKKSQYGDMNFIQNEMPPEQEKPNGSTKARENMLMSARENKLMNNDVLSIVASSSPLKESDKVYLQEFPIAYDSIAVVVNNENPVKVKSLSLKQLRSIYQGETKFWEDISGGERKNRIKVYQRSKNSGTREVFKNIILGENEDFVEWQEPDYYEEETSDKDSPSVRKVQNKDRDRDWTNNGIYYMTSSEAIKQEKDGVITIVKIDEIYPEPENILDGKYKFSRMVYLVIPNKSRVTVQEFIRNVLSEEGQKIVKESGFIPLKSRNSKN